MNSTIVKERIETISKEQISQLLVNEVCGLSATVYTEIIGVTKPIKEVEKFGFTLMVDEEGNYDDKNACFYDERDFDNLMNFIDSKEISESSINFDNHSITINFDDDMEVYIEIM